MKKGQVPLNGGIGQAAYERPPTQDGVIEQVYYTRPPTSDGAIDPLAYKDPPAQDQFYYIRPPAPDGAIDPLAYKDPPAQDQFYYIHPPTQDGAIDPLAYKYPPTQDGAIALPVYTNPSLQDAVELPEVTQPPILQVNSEIQKATPSEENIASSIIRAAKDGTVDQQDPILKEKQASQLIKAMKASATNFFVKPVRRVIHINRMGEEVPEREIIESLVYINEISHQITFKVKDIENLTKIVQRRFAEAILDHQEQNAAKAMEERFRDAVSHCPPKFVYFEAGWQQIRSGRVYLRDGLKIGDGIEVDTGMTLPSVPYNAEILREIWERSMGICKKPMTMATIFSFSLMGILYRLFEEAGYAPHFTLFLYGKTGSMKTTVAKIFFTQLCEDTYRDRVRRIDADTETALERAVVLKGRDTITLIDDFSPAKTERKKHEMTDKLEMVIRMVGDGSSRSRSSMKLDDRRGEGVQGMVALTGELLGKGVSSNLRCLYCKMEREEMNDEMVTWFQENESCYTTLIAAFADYVGANYERIVDIIRAGFGKERKELSGILKERRLIDSAVTLRIAANIFGMFLIDCCGMPGHEVESRISEMQLGILDCALISEELSTDESPGVVFMQAISALMRTGHILLMPEKRMLTELEEGDGFEDENFLYFNPDIVHKKVVSFLRQTNRYFPYDLKEVLAMLADDGIIKTAANGQGKRTYCTRVPMGNGTRQNFLKIRKSMFDSIRNNEFECGKGEYE